jgi:hypothetical protein
VVRFERATGSFYSGSVGIGERPMRATRPPLNVLILTQLIHPSPRQACSSAPTRWERGPRPWSWATGAPEMRQGTLACLTPASPRQLSLLSCSIDRYIHTRSDFVGRRTLLTAGVFVSGAIALGANLSQVCLTSMRRPC